MTNENLFVNLVLTATHFLLLSLVCLGDRLRGIIMSILSALSKYVFHTENVTGYPPPNELPAVTSIAQTFVITLADVWILAYLV